MNAAEQCGHGGAMFQSCIGSRGLRERIGSRNHHKPSKGSEPSMNPAKAEPSSLVEVSVPSYMALSTGLYGEEAERWWKDLGDLLYGRPGWYCEMMLTSQIELSWSFGAMKASMFNISYDGEPDYALFDYIADSTTRFQTIGELREWLDDNESRHADHAHKLRDLASMYDWKVLKTVGFDVDVTTDGDVWIGTVRTLPVTMSAGSSLVDTVSQLRQAIAHTFDAPASVAGDIQVRVHLDTTAASALNV